MAGERAGFGCYDFAGLKLGIAGFGRYADALRGYFGREATELFEPEDADLLVVVHRNPDEMNCDFEYYSLSKKISFDKKVFAVRGPQVAYAVSNMFGAGGTVLDVAPTVSGKGARSIASAAYHKTVSSSIDRTNSLGRFVNAVTNYSLLWYVLAICLMKQDKVFVHSGMMSREERGFVVAGTSGCGKTSTMMELLQRPGWKYLAEDFGVLDRDGFIWSVPKKAAIYQSDVSFGNQRLEAALGELDVYHGLRWKIANSVGGNSCYHFSGEELFGFEGVASRARLDRIAFFARVSGTDSIVVRDADPSDLAERVATASFREIKQLYEVLCNIRAVAESECRAAYPSMRALYERYLDILHEGLKGVSCIELRVPLGARPEDLANALLESTSDGEAR